MKIIIIIFSLFVLAFARHDHKTNIKPKIIFHISETIDTSRYAILHFDKGDIHLFDKNDTPTTLSTAEIEKIEKLINRAVLKNKKKSKNFYIKNASKYYKQLIAVINSKREKEVWINCLCSIDGIENWKKNIVGVLDGGPCYFNLKVNLNKDIFFDFIVNNYE
jgi:hypothetical protein